MRIIKKETFAALAVVGVIGGFALSAPSIASAADTSSRHGHHAEPGDDHGGRHHGGGHHAEPGDDNGGHGEPEPGDNRHGEAEPGDDHGGRHHGGEAEPGDDHGGHGGRHHHHGEPEPGDN